MVNDARPPVTMPSLSDDREDGGVAFVLHRLPSSLLCRLSSVGSCNGLIRNSADAFGVNTGFREKGKLIRGSLITRMVEGENREGGEKKKKNLFFIKIIVNWRFGI